MTSGRRLLEPISIYIYISKYALSFQYVFHEDNAIRNYIHTNESRAINQNCVNAESLFYFDRLTQGQPSTHAAWSGIPCTVIVKYLVGVIANCITQLIEAADSGRPKFCNRSGLYECLLYLG